MMRKVLNLAVVTMLAAPALLLGQSGDANKVLSEMRAALGGDAKLAAVKTMTVSGRALRPNPMGTTTVENEFELAVELPGKYMMRTVLANLGNMSIYRNTGFNGDGLINLTDTPPNLAGGGAGQMITRLLSGNMSMSGQELTPAEKAEQDRKLVLTQKKEFARLTIGMFGQSFSAFPLEFSSVGEAEAADGKADVVDVKGPGDFTGRLFVDQKTRLPLMLTWMELEPVQLQSLARGGMPAGAQMGGGGRQMTPEDIQNIQRQLEERMRDAEAARRMVEYRIFYGDFKTVGGIKIPHSIQRSIDGKPSEELTLDQVKINPKIDARKFEITK